MKKECLIFCFALSFVFFSSCKKEEGMVFTLATEDFYSPDKVRIDNQSYCVWDNGDEVTIKCSRQDAQRCSVNVADNKATIVSNISTSGNQNYFAAYPASAWVGNGSDYITVNIPKVQTYQEDNNGMQKVDVPMVAKTSRSEKVLYFHNAAVLYKVHVPAHYYVNQIYMFTRNIRINGQVKCTLGDNNAIAAVDNSKDSTGGTSISDNDKTIILNCSSVYTGDKGKDFYLVGKSFTHQNGDNQRFTIQIKASRKIGVKKDNNGNLQDVTINIEDLSQSTQGGTNHNGNLAFQKEPTAGIPHNTIVQISTCPTVILHSGDTLFLRDYLEFDGNKVINNLNIIGRQASQFSFVVSPSVGSLNVSQLFGEMSGNDNSNKLSLNIAGGITRFLGRTFSTSSYIGTFFQWDSASIYQIFYDQEGAQKWSYPYGGGSSLGSFSLGGSCTSSQTQGSVTVGKAVGSTYGYVGKLYSCTLTNGNGTYRYLIPCWKKNAGNGGTFGMYSITNSTSYPSKFHPLQ